MMKHIICLLSLLLTGGTYCFAQHDYANVYHDKVRLHTDSETVVATLNPVGKPSVCQPDRIYAWYKAGQINYSTGGFSGKLLDGLFESYYLNKQLKTQGAYVKGLKDGEWRSWSNKGEILRLESWRKGVLHGNFKIYTDSSRLAQEGKNRYGKLDGKVMSYDASGKKNTAFYKNGVPSARTSNNNLWSRVKGIVKRKDSNKKKKCDN